MNVQNAYMELVTATGTFLKGEGFGRKGCNFHRRYGNNWGVCSFQKSGKSTVQEVLFTFNIGVASEKLLEFFSPAFQGKPSIDSCHWRERIGFYYRLVKRNGGHLAGATQMHLISDELTSVLAGVAIPAIERYSSDEKLQNEWLEGRSPGLTNIQRLINLSVLLHASRNGEALHAIVSELRAQSEGTPAAPLVQRHLQRLAGTLGDKSP